jgi:acyl-CoA thioesterase II
VSEDEADMPDVVTQLALEVAGPDVYRFPAMPSKDSWDHLFGGQVLALALRAAGLTVPGDRLPHSLHSYFLRRGSSAKSMVLKVERDTDGRSFSARRVTVLQDSLPIFTMAASFHLLEDGPDEQTTQMPPGVPDPASLAGSGLQPGGRPGHGLVEVRNVQSPGHDMPRQAWARASGAVGEDPLLHACALAHFSDLYSGLPHIASTGEGGGPSLDHALWFHRPIRLDDWVLMSLDPVSTGRGRGLYKGGIWDRHGTLGATLAQETLYSTSRPTRGRPPWLAPDDDARA